MKNVLTSTLKSHAKDDDEEAFIESFPLRNRRIGFPLSRHRAKSVRGSVSAGIPVVNIVDLHTHSLITLTVSATNGNCHITLNRSRWA